MQTSRRFVISGRVQGVGFRYFVQSIAVREAVVGWVRNLDDGRVEVYAIGPANKISDLAAALHKGPMLSDVRGVEEQEAAAGRYSNFQIEV